MCTLCACLFTQNTSKKLSVVSFRRNKITSQLICKRKKQTADLLPCIYLFIFSMWFDWYCEQHQRRICAWFSSKRKITFNTIGWVQINFICSKFKRMFSTTNIYAKQMVGIPIIDLRFYIRINGGVGFSRRSKVEWIDGNITQLRIRPK